MRHRLICLQILGLLAVCGGAIAAPESSPISVDPAVARQTLVEYYQEHEELPRDGGGPWIELIAKAGGPEELRMLCDQVAKGNFEAAATVRAVDALAEASRSRHLRPAPAGGPADPVVDPDYQTLLRLLHFPDAKVQAAAARLAGAWQVEYVGQPLAELAGGNDPEGQVAAFEALRAIGGKTALAFFSVLARPDQSIRTRCRALVAIAEIQLDAAVVQAADVLPAIDDEGLALETWRGLLKVPRAANAFAVRLPADLPGPVLKAGVQAGHELGRSGESLVKRLTSILKKKGTQRESEAR